jgi:bacterial/archaeal transporter family protein
MSVKLPAWLSYSVLTVLLWGAWGVESKAIVDRTNAFTGQFLFTYGLIVPAVIALASRRRFEGKHQARGFGYAVLTGLLGGIGNIAFYMALMSGKTAIVAPLTSLFPLVTVLLAVAVLKERLTPRQGVGLVIAVAAICFLSV